MFFCSGHLQNHLVSILVRLKKKPCPLPTSMVSHQPAGPCDAAGDANQSSFVASCIRSFRVRIRRILRSASSTTGAGWDGVWFEKRLGCTPFFLGGDFWMTRSWKIMETMQIFRWTLSFFLWLIIFFNPFFKCLGWLAGFIETFCCLLICKKILDRISRGGTRDLMQQVATVEAWCKMSPVWALWKGSTLSICHGSKNFEGSECDTEKKNQNASLFTSFFDFAWLAKKQGVWMKAWHLSFSALTSICSSACCPHWSRSRITSHAQGCKQNRSKNVHES